MKTTLSIIVVIILIFIGFYIYFSAPVAAPSEDIVKVVDEVVPETTTAETYTIIQEGSLAKFSITETLRGEPFTAVGTTNQIAGSFSLDLENPASSVASVFKVNARTLKTDSTQRDGAIARTILNSEDPANEYIELSDIAISKMPAKITIDEEFAFTLSGNLKIKGTTKPAIFFVNAKLDASGTFTANAEGSVNRSDYGLTIPSLSFIADVNEVVDISVSITAKKN